jgi:hypothetical protein
MKPYLLVYLIIFSTSLISCKKECRKCDCTQNGQRVTYENCAIGSAGIRNLDTWEQYLVEKQGCEEQQCYVD